MATLVVGDDADGGLLVDAADHPGPEGAVERPAVGEDDARQRLVHDAAGVVNLADDPAAISNGQGESFAAEGVTHW